MLKDTESVEMAERVNYDMSNIVKISIDVITIGGADYKGAIDKSELTEQFVIPGSLYNKLGRALGVHIGGMVEKLASSIDDYVEFKDAVIEGLAEYAAKLRDDLDEFDKRDE